MNKELLRSQLLVKYVSFLSITEAGLGSLLHAFHVPLSGHLLSLNESYLLQSALKEYKIAELKRMKLFTLVFQISVLSALFKSLSPAGKKLTPMIAISVQGILYAFCILLFGANLIGLVFGMLVSSLWAFLQPLLFAWLVFGKKFFEAFYWGVKNICDSLNIDIRWGLLFFLSLVIVKLLIGLILVFLPEAKMIKSFNQYLAVTGKKILVAKRKNVNQNPVWGAICDLFSPLMLLSFLLMGIFYFYTANEISNNNVWLFLRSLSAAFMLFYLIRVFPIKKLSEYFKAKNPVISKTLLKVEEELYSHHDT